MKRLLNPYGLETRALVLYHILVLCLAIFSVDRIAATMFLPDADSKEVVLISSTTCPHSRAVRTRLVASGIPFREVESRESLFSGALAAWAFQSLSVPIVVVGPEVIYGDRQPEIDLALASLGYNPSPPSSGVSGP